MRSDFFDIYEFSTSTGNRVRYTYSTSCGEPPKAIKLNGRWWLRAGFHPLSTDPTLGLVWYKE